MTFVSHVPDHLVTDLVYRHLPSWHALACYFDWRKHYAAKTRDDAKVRALASMAGKNLQRRGAVLTDEGWVIPTGPMNPRVIDQPNTFVSFPVDEQTDAEVDNQQVDHELAILKEDLFVFRFQWLRTVEGKEAAARIICAIDGASEEREAYMARWHGENRPG